MPVEPTTATGIAFAPNVTPVTFNDPMPPMVDAPSCESVIFPPPDDCPLPRRPGHSKKKPENHIPRPPNAFILFRSSFIKSQHVSTEVETNHSTLSKIIGLTWQNLPNDERQVWHAKAKAALDEHKRKFPQYAFRPLHNKGRGGPEKRKVREVGPKDLKRCAKIAELLVEGKKGQELDAAIQEFDKHHVPEVITRFEAPLTARMYRRSSSAPVPDTEHSQPRPFLPSTPSTSSRKPRASSSRPTRYPTPTPSPSPPYQQPHTPAESEVYYPASPSYDSYSFPSKQESPFVSLSLHLALIILLTVQKDFTFSFNDIVSPTPIFACDPLSENNIAALSPVSGMLPDDVNPSRPPLSIDTSFIDDWSRSSPSTSASPSTTSHLDSPCPSSDPYGSYMLDSFDTTFTKPFDSHSSPFQVYSNTCQSPFEQHCGNQGGGVYINSPSDFVSFEHDHPKAELAHLDLEFSAFMASLPQYSL